MSTLTQRKNIAKASGPSEAVAAPTSDAQDSSAKFKTQAPRFRSQKIFARVVLSSAVFIIVYFTSSREKTSTLAGIKEILSLREHKVDCSAESFSMALSCGPSMCGRFASDNVISEAELLKLRELTNEIFARFFAKDEEISVTFDLFSKRAQENLKLKEKIDDVLKPLQPKLIDTISQRFQTSHKSIALTSPSYISRLTDIPTEFTETLHQLHYDMEASEAVHFTMVIFLSNFKRDFTNGKFIFVDVEKNKKKNIVIEPKAGRVLGYTTGSENNHYIDKVKNGASYFVTLSFTCEGTSSLEKK